MFNATFTSRIPSSAASNNATSAKTNNGSFYGVTCYNGNAAMRYLKLYDKASAPNPAADTPKLSIPLPPTSLVNIQVSEGLYFGTGIAYALVTGSADNDNTAVGAGDILGLNLYLG